MTFAIHIATRDRRDDLLTTLASLESILDRAACTVYDDGSDDGTSDAVKARFPQVSVWRNDVPRGYLYCRNRMLNACDADIAVSLDDDANFLSPGALGNMAAHFTANQNCGVAAFRIFWGVQPVADVGGAGESFQVKSFVGCGHAWRMAAWKSVPDYPEWFQFYGEENFASMHLFEKGWRVDYLPQILVHHRVDMKARSRHAAMMETRARNALRADWYNFALFLPLPVFLRKMGSSLWHQLRSVVKGKRPLSPILLAMKDFVGHIPKLARQRSAMGRAGYRAYEVLPPAQVFWKPPPGPDFPQF
jgi:GT2 family glycosyltransferase